MTTADQLKLTMMCHWRFNAGHPIVALEYHYGSADVLSISDSGQVYETEVKVNIGDLKRDRKKPKHRVMETGTFRFPGPNYFYFAVPEEIGEKAKDVVKQMYPYAGLLSVGNWVPDPYNKPVVYLLLRPKPFVTPRLFISEAMWPFARAMSNTTCNLAAKLLMIPRPGRIKLNEKMLLTRGSV